MADVNSLLGDAAELMLMGMIFVFSFLGILIFVVQSLAKWLPKDQPAPVPHTKHTSKPTTVQGIQPEMVAAVAAAVQLHRQRTQ